jgi:hypothetical protein
MISKDSDFLTDRLKQLRVSALNSNDATILLPTVMPRNLKSSRLKFDRMSEYDSENISCDKNLRSYQANGFGSAPLRDLSLNEQRISNISKGFLTENPLDCETINFIKGDSAKKSIKILESFENDSVSRRCFSQQMMVQNCFPVDSNNNREKRPSNNTSEITSQVSISNCKATSKTPSIKNLIGSKENILEFSNLADKTKDMTVKRDRCIISERTNTMSMADRDVKLAASDRYKNENTTHFEYGMRNQNDFGRSKEINIDINDNEIGKEVLNSLNLSNFYNKHEEQIISELHHKLNTEIEKNNQIQAEVMNLRKRTEINRIKLLDFDHQLKDKMTDFRQKENEGLERIEFYKDHLSSMTIKERETDNIKICKVGQFGGVTKENEMLRNEIRRLAQITSEKILDIENNINAIIRMKDLEKENFKMEASKVENSSEFLIEQMKSLFQKKHSQIEERISGLIDQKNRIVGDLKIANEELVIFNLNANERISNEIAIINEQESERHNKEMRLIEVKIKYEEEDILKMHRLNEIILTQIQYTDCDGKRTLMICQKENDKLKEDLGSLRSEYNKVLIQISKVAKEVEEKIDNNESAKQEQFDAKNKAVQAEQGYTEELEDVVAAYDEVRGEMEDIFNDLLKKEQSLIKSINECNERLICLKKRQSAAIESVQDSVNRTLNDQFNQLRQSRSG